MRILITGGAGFIGSHIADRYVAAGHDVAVIDNFSTGSRDNLDDAVTVYDLNIQDPDVRRAFEDFRPDILSHHAAQMSVAMSVKDPLHDADVNVIGTLRLLESAVATGVKKVIFASSGGTVYGDAEVCPTPEESPLSAASPYGISKISGEHYLRYYGSHHGLPWTILRYSNVYGPRQNPKGEAGVIAIFSELLREGRPALVHAAEEPGDGGCIRDYVYVSDVAAANVRALDRGEGRAINIGTGVPTRTLALYEGLAKIEGTSRQADQGPPRPGDLKRNVLDISLAKELLDWTPRVALEEGLASTYGWWRAGRTAEMAGG